MSRDPIIRGITLQVHDVILKCTELLKPFGAKIDNKLTFHQHISDLCRRATCCLCTLSRFSGVLDIESKFKLLNAFIVSNFMYCSLVWHLCSVTDTMKTEKIQKNAFIFYL